MKKSPKMMVIKRTIKTILVLMIFSFVFRTWLYTHVMWYTSIGQRNTILLPNQALKEYLDANGAHIQSPSIEKIIELGLSLTSQKLSFTTARSEVDPNKSMLTQITHCVGYAAFFSTSCNYLLEKYHLSDQWKVQPQIGQLYFLGANIHHYFSSPFLKDHDFVTIENKATGEIYAVDPTVHDYLGITFVTYKK